MSIFTAASRIGYRPSPAVFSTEVLRESGGVHYQITGDRNPMPEALTKWWSKDSDGYYLTVSIGEYNRMFDTYKRLRAASGR